MIPIECVVRGYLAGSGWQEYQKTGEVCGIKLPSGLQEGDRLPKPIFTPATKAETGMHDQNITYNEMVWKLHDWMRGKEIRTDQIINHGSALGFWLQHISLEIYKIADVYAKNRGIIIADTKMEFGLRNGRLMLVDELLTPDSSRFWPENEWKPGGPQKSFDKQFLRDFLLSIRWDKNPPAPHLPEEIVQKTKEKYQEAFRKLTS